MKAQIINSVRDAAEKTKGVTVDVANKTADAATEIVTDQTVKLVDNVKGTPCEGDRWLVVTASDGTKWISKQTWFAAKKAPTATKETIIAKHSFIDESNSLTDRFTTKAQLFNCITSTFIKIMMFSEKYY